MNAIWIIIGSAATFAVAYRLYGAFLSARVAMLDDRRPTPAWRLRDGVDYQPTNRWVLFGHHFAAIAGPGPLLGPVLAAQWGYLPGLVWIVIGACLAGAVHDFVILWASVRSDGLSLPKIARREIGDLAGVTTSVATLFIIICTLASVAIVVVQALSKSAWGMFTIIITIPAALLTGLWMYKIRPGRVAEASALGVAIVLAGVILGKPFADSTWAAALIFDKPLLALLLPAYALLASVLPVWVLMCPRDYLSSYMKIGVMVVLAAALLFAAPDLKMPALTPFVAGGGPIISGPLWPFVCIVIMCGAISGFHALISSGTTPKMIRRESDIRPIGYGAMVLEGFVAITALVAACALEPGDYFAINAPAASYPAFVERAALDHGWDVAPRELGALEAGVHEQLAGRTGGAVTLAVGIAKVFTSLPGMSTLMGYWYHFVIMFEALFILTLLETGTRVARFVFQEALQPNRPHESPRDLAAADPAVAYAPDHEQPLPASGNAPAAPRRPKWILNISVSVLVCAGWGYLLYAGNLDTLWRMLGIANQLLATIALAVGTTYLLRHAARRRYALLTGIPLVFVLVTTFAAGIYSIDNWRGLIARGAPEATLLRITCLLAALMLVLTALIAALAVRQWLRMLRSGPAKALPIRIAQGN